MKGILFVDDEPNVLDGLRRMLSRHRAEWRMDFAAGGEEALRILAQSPVDVIVTDMRMPGLNGAQLLSQVAQQYPQIVRIVLSGMYDRELLLLSAASAHQFLKKPCDAEVLQTAITRALTLQSMLTDSNLRSFISRVKSLPSVPSTYLELVDAARTPDVPVARLSQIISKDLAMASKVLQLVNSPLVGIRRRILNPAEACVYLGVDTITALVFSAAVFCQFRQVGLSYFSAEDLQDHSLRIAALAKAVAQCEGLSHSATEEALLAGLLHDVGKLVLASSNPRQYDHCVGDAMATGEPLLSAEKRVFGITHAEAGMYLLRLWGLPDTVTEAVALHHRPQEGAGTSFGPLAAVYVADTLSKEDHGGSPLDSEYLTRLGVDSRVPEWRRLRSRYEEG